MTELSLTNYKITRELGQGGMATVYEAIQYPMERRVALKVLLPHLALDEQFIVRFQWEMKALAKFNNPHIVTIYDAGKQDENYYIAMELLEGGTFGERIKQGCSVEQTLSVVRGVAQALAISHSAEIIHRDVKPDNILFRDRNSFEPVLTDFGIAKDAALEHTVTLTGVETVIGSPAFMSPEQALGKELDYRSDIFSLGIVLYYSLTRSYPYTASSIGQLVLAHKDHQRDPLPSGCSALQSLLDAMLTIDREDRHITTGAIIQFIDSGSSHGSGGATDDATIVRPEPEVRPPPEPIPRVAKADNRSTMVKLLTGVALATLVVSGAAWVLISGTLQDSDRARRFTPQEAATADAEGLSTAGAYLASLSTLPLYTRLSLADGGGTIDEDSELLPGDYQIQAIAPGYEPATIVVNIPGDIPRVELTLKQFVEIDEFYDYSDYINGDLSGKEFLKRYPSSLMAKVIAIENSPNSDALRKLKRLAKQGDPPSQVQLSELYDYGIGVGKDTEQALYWSSQAARKGYAVAALQHSSLVLDYSDDPAEIENAIATLERLADAGFFLANNLMADIYLAGKHRTKDVDTALVYLKRAAELGDPVARKRYDSARGVQPER